VSSVPLQQALRHLDKAFRTFFEGRAKYPAFKKKAGRYAATYASSAFRWDAEIHASPWRRWMRPWTFTGRDLFVVHLPPAPFPKILLGAISSPF
jgi:hypothetical protein